MRHIDNVQQQIGLAHLIKSRFEGLDKICRKLADESYSIGQQERQILDYHLAHRCIERREELVLGKDLALGKQVHQGRFTYVGIAHKRHTYKASAVLALYALLAVNLRQLFLEQRHAAKDYTAVHLELCLTRATETHAAALATSGSARAATLTLEVSPQTLQTREHIFVLRKLNLHLGMRCLCAHGKDIEDE